MGTLEQGWQLQNKGGVGGTWEQGWGRWNPGTRVGGDWETMAGMRAWGQGYRSGKGNIKKWNRRLTSEKVRSSSGTGLCMVMMMMLVRLKLAYGA